MESSGTTSSRKKLCRRGLKFSLVAACCYAVMLGDVLRVGAGSFANRPVAVTSSGVIVGKTKNGINQFLGIPYAAPPVGALRWTPPQPAKFLPLPFEANNFGSECPQVDSADQLAGDENCLFLNVYTPSSSLANGVKPFGRRVPSGLPVMVWIPGGSLLTGAGSDYDPTRLVNKGVIVVTLNYRLGFLGFFAQQAIDAEGHLNGNYGLMDQQFAIKWVQRNIRAFGGDPRRITIFGESAGGQSIYAQLASPTAAGLFQGAIAESGAYLQFQDYYNLIVPLAVAETIGTVFVPSGATIAAAAGCGSMASSACLRAVPASVMVALEAEVPFALLPFVDGVLLPATPTELIATGDFNQVPVITGSNHDEYRIFVAGQYDLAGNPILTEAEYETAVNNLWGVADLTPFVLFFYPYNNYPSGGVALGASGTDGIFACPERNSAELLSQFVTTYAYEFNDENAPPPQSDIPGLTFPLGAYHSAELQYLFKGNFFGIPNARLSAKQKQLSNAMVSYWTQFAKTGNPNSRREPTWPAYSVMNDEFLSLVPPTPQVETDFATEHLCSVFWDTF
jgi:para-nitrobenzyl esterase